MSHVGDVTFHSTLCSYLTPEGLPSGRYSEAEVVVVTTTGDEIYSACTCRPFDETRCLGFIRITGGSGQYEGARGSLIAITTVDPATLDVSIRSWGWMLC